MGNVVFESYEHPFGYFGIVKLLDVFLKVSVLNAPFSAHWHFLR